jgi:hypothetical protein
VILTNGLARFVSHQKATDLTKAGRIVSQGDHHVEAYPCALHEIFESAAVRLDRTPNNKGWEVKSSGGMPTWQLLEGGRFQPV